MPSRRRRRCRLLRVVATAAAAAAYLCLCVCVCGHASLDVCVCGVFNMLRFACCSGKPQNTPRANFAIVVVAAAFLRCAAVA